MDYLKWEERGQERVGNNLFANLFTYLKQKKSKFLYKLNSEFYKLNTHNLLI